VTQKRRRKEKKIDMKKITTNSLFNLLRDEPVVFCNRLAKDQNPNHILTNLTLKKLRLDAAIILIE